MLVFGPADGDGTISMEMHIVLDHLVSTVATQEQTAEDSMLYSTCTTQQVQAVTLISGQTTQMEIRMSLHLLSVV